MFVYNPLGSYSALFKLYASAPCAPAEPPDPTDLLRLYARLAPRPPGVAADAVLEEDRRELTARLRGFLPLLLDRSDLPADLKRVPIVFPRSRVLDARSIQDRQRGAAFVTSGTLDAIQLFARTISTCARLNQLVLPDLAAIEEQPPEHVPLAWVTLRGDQLPGMTIGELLAREDDPTRAREHLFEQSRWIAEHLRPGHTRYLLSHYLMQLTMRAIRRATLDPTGWDPAFDARNLSSDRVADSPIDRRFLELMTLAVIVLHELGHVVLGHNRIGYRGTETEVALSAQFGKELRESEDAEHFVDLVGTQSSFELAADVFAVEVLDETLREPALEVASLWCAAKERAHFVTGDRVDDLVRMSQSPEHHPSHAVRVWYLNGRLSTGRRQGPIARAIASAAETAGLELDRAESDPAREVALFAALWDLVDEAVSDDPRVWGPPAVEATAAPRSPEQAMLELGLHTWEAGQIEQAEKHFRAAAGGADPNVVAQAHGLIGRMLEEQGDARAAEAEYRLADELGDGNAANDLGTLLQERGDLTAAISAFQRADERGNAPGAFNLALIAEERGERPAAVAAFRRADQRGHRHAALNLGILSYHAGDLDAAEAALRRAETRGVDNAATYLGIVLRDRGDVASAEAAWQRGAERGELDALHSLGFLLEEQERLDEARGAYLQAVIQGRGGSAGNLRAIDTRLAEVDQAPALQTAAAGGDADAAYQLGFLMARRGDTDSAVTAWLLAERLGHPKAANELGLVYSARGDTAAAEAAFRHGAERGHPRALFNLGVTLHELGDEEGAEVAWNAADQLGDPLAATNLGSTLEATGDLDAALSAYERADQRGDGLGRVRLGRLLEQRQELGRAEAAYRRADEAGDGIAAAALGRLLFDRGDVDGAEAAWRRGDLRGSQDAALQLGLLLRGQAKLDAAEAAIRRAIERGHPSAIRHLAFLLSQAGYKDDAVEALMTPIGENVQVR